MIKYICNNCEQEILHGDGSRYYMGNRMIAGRWQPVYLSLENGGLCDTCWPLVLEATEEREKAKTP